MNDIKLPPDVVARVESAELQTLVKKVKDGGVLTKAERQTFAVLTAKYQVKTGADGKPQETLDPVPVSPDEGGTVQRVSRAQKAARIQVVHEWTAHGLAYREQVTFATKRWGIAPRTADYLFADARRDAADPRAINLAFARDVQLRRLTLCYQRRMSGEDARDPLEPLREIGKLLGLNAPERTESRQEFSTPDSTPLVQFLIPDNGRAFSPNGEAGLS